MSEHRSEMRDNISKYLNAKRCQLWPDCSCKPNLIYWQNKFSDEDRVWDFESFAWAETSIYLTLCCVAERCPERRYRAFAQVNLLNPWWDRQRKGIELTKEMYQQLAEKSNARR